MILITRSDDVTWTLAANNLLCSELEEHGEFSADILKQEALRQHRLRVLKFEREFGKCPGNVAYLVNDTDVLKARAYLNKVETWED